MAVAKRKPRIKGYAEGGYIPGMSEVGNIDLHNRPVVSNPDGSKSTVRSISIGTDKGHYLIPTVVGNKVVSNEDAVANFKRTGQHLGKFDTRAEADAYAQTLHEDQAKEYLGKAKGGKVRRVIRRKRR